MSNSVITLLGLNLNHIWDFSPSLCLPAADPKLQVGGRNRPCAMLLWSGMDGNNSIALLLCRQAMGGLFIFSGSVRRALTSQGKILASQEKPRDCSGPLLPAHTSSTISSIPPLPYPDSLEDLTMSLVEYLGLSWKQVTQALSTLIFPNIKGDFKNKERLFPPLNLMPYLLSCQFLLSWKKEDTSPRCSTSFV